MTDEDIKQRETKLREALKNDRQFQVKERTSVEVAQVKIMNELFKIMVFKKPDFEDFNIERAFLSSRPSFFYFFLIFIYLVIYFCSIIHLLLFHFNVVMRLQ